MMFTITRSLLFKWLTILALCCVMGVSAVFAQSTITIDAPVPGDTIDGEVEISGSTVIDDFARYEIAFQQTDSEWVVFAQGNEQIENGVLASWDTASGRDLAQPIFPNGSYTLRLRVVRQDNTFEEFYAGNITVLNSEFEGEEVIDEAESADSQSDDQPTPEPEETAIPTVEVDALENPNEPEPTLTPFPDVLPDQGLVPEGEQRDGPTEDPLLVAADSIESLDYSRFGRAFVFGIQGALILFGLFLAYLLLRNTLRKLWWLITTKLFR